MAPFPFTFWADYEYPSPTPTPTGTPAATPSITPTPTKTPAVNRRYYIECSAGAGNCPGASSVVVSYYNTSGVLSSITYTGAQLNAGQILCARNYPSPPTKTSGVTPITITDTGTC